ncbi:hypothetical protein V1478_018807, partial [Vespula squamosa]
MADECFGAIAELLKYYETYKIWQLWGPLKFVGLQKQQPPRGETWVGITCDISKSNMTQVLPGEWLHYISMRY